MLVMKILLYNTLQLQYSVLSITFISNTATKKVSEDKEFSYYSTVLHQRVEGEFAVTAAMCAS